MFNSYLGRLLESRDLSRDLFEFKGKELQGIRIKAGDEPPLFPDSGVVKKFPGFLVIERKR